MRKRHSISPKDARRVALYLRRSTNEELQPDSLDIQEEILRAYAAKLGDQVVAVFSESASGRDADGRTEFSRLIDIVVSGAADFDAILVRDVSRWGRFDNIDESAYYDFLCFRHQVQVVYAEEAFGSDQSPFASLMKSMKRVLAAEYSREKSRIIKYGKKRSAGRGFHSGGLPPYGMKRVLVEPSGAFVQDLPRGLRKAVSALKTKLAPKRDETTETVEWIFESFVERRLRPAAIARSLNGSRIASPGGKLWSVATVTHVLETAIYAGVGTLNTPEETIAVDGAYEAVVSRELFDGAQERFRDLRRADYQTRSRLIREARAAYDRWGHLPASLLHEIAGVGRTYPERARFSEALLDDVFAPAIALEKRKLVQVLAGMFTVDDHGAYLILDGRMRVGFLVGWRRIDLVRGPAVFNFLGTEPDDFVICLGCESEPAFAVTCRCLASGEKIRSAGPRRVLRNVAARKRSPTMVSVDSDTSLLRWLQRSMWNLPHLARAAVREVTQGADVVTFNAMGRELHWPPGAARRAYYAVRASGEPLPELLRDPARPPKVPPAPKTKTSGLLLAVCRQCKAERYVWPSIAKKMKGGLDALCHRCSLAKGREATLSRNHESRAARRAKYEFLREIALMLLRVMASRNEYERPTVWSMAVRRFATLRWKSRSDGAYHRLSLDCSEDFMQRCASAGRDATVASLADAILDRRTWIGGHGDKKTDHVWVRRLE